MNDLVHRAQRRRHLVAAIVATALLVPVAAGAKDLQTIVCGRDGCRVAAAPLAGVATTGRAATPRTGRFFTLRLSFGSAPTPGYALIYERRRHLVRAGDSHARAFLGTGWHVLDLSLRPHFARAVAGRLARQAP